MLYILALYYICRRKIYMYIKYIILGNLIYKKIPQFQIVTLIITIEARFDKKKE